jgi:hypothetical protein
MKPPPPISAAAWRQRYETLRQHVLERRQVLGADPMGLVVLLGQGVAGWMRSWWEPSPPSPAPAPLPLPRCPATPQWQEQLTGLLAHITAQHL